MVIRWLQASGHLIQTPQCSEDTQPISLPGVQTTFPKRYLANLIHGLLARTGSHDHGQAHDWREKWTWFRLISREAWMLGNQNTHLKGYLISCRPASPTSTTGCTVTGQEACRKSSFCRIDAIFFRFYETSSSREILCSFAVYLCRWCTFFPSVILYICRREE